MLGGDGFIMFQYQCKSSEAPEVWELMEHRWLVHQEI